MNQITILDYCRVLWRAKWLILCVTFLSAVVAWGIVRRQPKVYTAKATMLTIGDVRASMSTSLGAMLGMGGGGGGREGGNSLLSIPGVSTMLPSVTTNEDTVIALLKSRTLKEKILADFEKALGPSVGTMLVSMDASAKAQPGVITVTVEATDRDFAANVANAYFDHLDQVLQRNAARARTRQERFYAAQLEQSAKDLAAAEEALLKFQTENRILATDLSSKGGKEFDGAVSVRAAIMQLELQREVMRMRFTDAHPQVREIQKQVAELKRQYSQNLYGTAMDLPPESSNAKGTRKEFFVAAAKMTPVQFGFMKLLRNLKIQEAFYVAAQQGLEQLKYDQGSSPVNVDVLDPALPPKGPSRPDVMRSIQVAALSGLIVGSLLAFVLEYVWQLWRERRLATVSPLTESRRPADGRARPEVPSADIGRVAHAASRATGPHAGGPVSARTATVPEEAPR
jgi:uncharacterized protein involved in exopolysaccharide biosynthesis